MPGLSCQQINLPDEMIGQPSAGCELKFTDDQGKFRGDHLAGNLQTDTGGKSSNVSIKKKAKRDENSDI